MNKALHCSCAAHTELSPCELAPGLKGLYCTSCDGHPERDELLALLRADW